MASEIWGKGWKMNSPWPQNKASIISLSTFPTGRRPFKFWAIPSFFTLRVCIKGRGTNQWSPLEQGWGGKGEVGCLSSVSVSGSSYHLTGAQMCLVGSVSTLSWCLCLDPSPSGEPSPIPQREVTLSLCCPCTVHVLCLGLLTFASSRLDSLVVRDCSLITIQVSAPTHGRHSVHVPWTNVWMSP